MNRPVATSPGMVTLYDFTAKWCGPCKQMKPVLEALEKEYAGRMRLVVVDVDDDPVTAQQFSVRSMPTFVLVRDGREVGRIVGSRPRAFVAGVLDRALGGDVAITSP
ncbi:MAG TPA: thioredoxin family protein [Kofleriaceae bacterium]|nr:thioredoxin family protein [Kofleriaceae bacterium]